ncbi:MAG: hypothetical protein NTAFB05_26430 [Nitrobacter sp.]|uniref:hypothetical protein n=1 Tax=Nitrobacter sp. TaxID=29420 RepID=UPI00387DDAAF
MHAAPVLATASAEGNEPLDVQVERASGQAIPYMKILWAAPPPDLENICRSTELYGPDYGFTEIAAFSAAREPMENGAMSDILLLALGLGCFALLALYGLASERL